MGDSNAGSTNSAGSSSLIYEGEGLTSPIMALALDPAKHRAEPVMARTPQDFCGDEGLFETGLLIVIEQLRLVTHQRESEIARLRGHIQGMQHACPQLVLAALDPSNPAPDLSLLG